jgi:putative membrane-bound dehydrogenase-like protein
MNRLLSVMLCSALTLPAFCAEVASENGLDSIEVPEGFSVESAITPGLSSYPMFMELDNEGNLYTAESTGTDMKADAMIADPSFMILRLTDRDDDGVYDSKTVFADTLTFPMGVLWHQGSLYVASPPDFVRLKDTTGDGVADEREVLLTGWNMRNSASLHGPFLGPDGWLYLTHGRHGYDITSKEGVNFTGKAARIWRCRPDGTQLERMAGGAFDNPIEIVFTDAGETLGTMTYFRDPAQGQRDALMHWVEGGVFPKPGPVMEEFVRSGPLMPTMTKFARIAPAGLLNYENDVWGDGYDNNLFSAQFNPHRVQRHVFTREGATFKTEDSDFLTSDHPDFHPTDVMQDADGSVLICDTGGWYVDACPVSRISKPEFVGGIFRVRKSGASPVQDPWGKDVDFATKSAEALIPLLKEARPQVRRQAFEQLVLRGKRSIAPLSDLLKASDDGDLRLKACWILGQLGGEAGRSAVRSALSDKDFRVRVAAARMSGLEGDRQAIPMLSALLFDPEAPVRRQAATSIGRLNGVEAGYMLYMASAYAVDPHEAHAITYATIQLGLEKVARLALKHTHPNVRRTAAISLDQMKDSPLNVEDVMPLLVDEDDALRETGLWLASRHSDWSGALLAQMMETFKSDGFVAEEAGGLEQILLAYAGSAEAQSEIAAMLTDAKADESRKAFLLDVVEGVSLDKLPDNWIGALGTVITTGPDSLRWSAVDLVQSRGLAEHDGLLAGQVADQSLDLAYRLHALAAIAGRLPELDAASAALVLGVLKDKESDPALRQTAGRICAAAPLGDETLVALAKEVIQAGDVLTLPALLRAYTGKESEPVGQALVASLKSPSIPPHMLSPATLTPVLASFPDAVKDAAEPLMAQHKAEEALRVEKLLELEPLVSTGDVGRGRRIFFGEKVACHTCHAVGDEGGNLGPDLTTVGLIRSGHDLVESVLFPSASLVQDFETYVVETEWETYDGVIARQDADSITMRTGVGEEVHVNRDEIVSMTLSPLSKMPDGLDTALTREEMVDLLTFMMSLNNDNWLIPGGRGE